MRSLAIAAIATFAFASVGPAYADQTGGTGSTLHHNLHQAGAHGAGGGGGAGKVTRAAHRRRLTAGKRCHKP